MKFIINFLIIVSTLRPIISSVEISPSSIRNTVNGAVGQTITIPCDIGMPVNGEAVYWFKRGQDLNGYSDKLISVGSEKIRPRYVETSWTTLYTEREYCSYYGIPYPSNNELFIVKLEESDEGLYLCEVKTSSNQTFTYEVQLMLIERPSILGISPSYTASLGNTFTLDAIVSGKPTPEIKWYFNGELIGTDQHLLLESVSEENAGSYKCVAWNQADTEEIAFELIVQYPPVVTALRSNRIAPLGSSIDLSCHIKAEPSATIQWFKDGVRINQNIQEFSIGSKGTGTVITIDETSESDYGTYVCRAKNGAGISQAVITLNEGSNMPLISHISPTQFVTLGDTTNLNCTVKNSHDDYPVMWLRSKPFDSILSINSAKVSSNPRYNVIRSESEASTFTLEITGATEADLGRYKCVVMISETRKMMKSVDLNKFIAPTEVK